MSILILTARNLYARFFENIHFYRAKQLCLCGLGDRNSVCLSVRLSVTRMLCDETKVNTGDILIPHERVILSSNLIPTEVGGRCPIHQ